MLHRNNYQYRGSLWHIIFGNHWNHRATPITLGGQTGNGNLMPLSLTPDTEVLGVEGNHAPPTIIISGAWESGQFCLLNVYPRNISHYRTTWFYDENGQSLDRLQLHLKLFNCIDAIKHARVTEDTTHTHTHTQREI